MKILIVLILSLILSTGLYSSDDREYLPESTILYVQADLYNLDELFKDLSYKFYSDVHYKQLKEYISTLTKSELGLDLMDESIISKQGIDFKNKLGLALIGPGSTKYNLLISAQIKDIKQFEESVKSIFLYMYPELKMREEFKGNRRSQQFKEMFKKDIKKLVFKKRIQDFQYKGYTIQSFRNKEKNYNAYQYNEVFSYVIINKRVFFGMKSTLMKMINAYIYKESLVSDKHLDYCISKADKSHRLWGYINFKALLNHFSLAPINEKTVLTLSDGLSFSININDKSLDMSTLSRLNDKHALYNNFIQAFDPKDKYKKSVMKHIPGDNYSYYLNHIDMDALQKLIPLYDVIAPIISIQQFYYPEFNSLFSINLSIYTFLKNTQDEGHFVLYPPAKSPIKTVDYHPHHLDFIYYTGIKSKSQMYNMIDSYFQYYFGTVNSKREELLIKDSFFYFIKDQDIQLYAGVYQGKLIVASQKARLLEFLDALESKNEKSDVKLLEKESKNLRELKKKASFITFMDFTGLPVDIEIFNKNLSPFKQFDFLYYVLYREASDLKSQFKIKFK